MGVSRECSKHFVFLIFQIITCNVCIIFFFIITVNIIGKLWRKRKDIDKILSLTTICCFIVTIAFVCFFCGLLFDTLIDINWNECNVDVHWSRNVEHPTMEANYVIIAILYGLHYFFLILLMYLRMKYVMHDMFIYVYVCLIYSIVFTEVLLKLRC